MYIQWETKMLCPPQKNKLPRAPTKKNPSYAIAQYVT